MLSVRAPRDATGHRRRRRWPAGPTSLAHRRCQAWAIHPSSPCRFGPRCLPDDVAAAVDRDGRWALSWRRPAVPSLTVPTRSLAGGGRAAPACIWPADRPVSALDDSPPAASLPIAFVPDLADDLVYSATTAAVPAVVRRRLSLFHRLFGAREPGAGERSAPPRSATTAIAAIVALAGGRQLYDHSACRCVVVRAPGVVVPARCADPRPATTTIARAVANRVARIEP